MNKTTYLLVALVAVLSLVLWGSPSFADDEWVPRTVQGYYQQAGWSTFEAGWLIGHRVHSALGGDLGQISDLIIDRSDGRIAFVILSDVPSFEDRYAAAPFSSLIRTGDDIFNLSFGGREVPIAQDYQYGFSSDPYARELERNARTLGLNRVPARIEPLWADNVYRFYGQTPRWGEGKTEAMMSYRAAGDAYSITALFTGEMAPRLLGATVRTSDGKTARIEDFVIDLRDGRIALIVLDDVAGRGDGLVAVPFGELSMSGNTFVLNSDGAKLAAAPEFKSSDLGDRRRAEDIYRYFGAQPYWTTGGGASMEEHHSDEMGPAMEEPYSDDTGAGAATMEP